MGGAGCVGGQEKEWMGCFLDECQELGSGQGTLRCCGRTDKLCVGEILRGGTRMPR